MCTIDCGLQIEVDTTLTENARYTHCQVSVWTHSDGQKKR